MGIYKQNQRCDVINGTDKLFFPPFQNHGDVIQTYSHDACKNFPLRYEYMKSIRGAKTAWKSLDMKDPLVLKNRLFFESELYLALINLYFRWILHANAIITLDVLHMVQ